MEQALYMPNGRIYWVDPQGLVWESKDGTVRLISYSGTTKPKEYWTGANRAMKKFHIWVARNSKWIMVSVHSIALGILIGIILEHIIGH